MIDLKEILINSNYKKETEELINIANLAYKHWETYWTGFNSTYVCEEILKDFENLNDLNFLEDIEEEDKVFPDINIDDWRK